MSQFSYKAVDANSLVVQGSEIADTADLARSALERRGLLVVQLQARRPDAPGGLQARAHVLLFTRAVAPLLRNGVPVLRALTAAETVVPQAFRPTVGDIRTRIERGETLEAALRHHPRAFGPLYVGLVRSGERIGNLGEAFEHLARHLERDAQLRARLGSALLYPALLVVTGTSVLLLVVLFVLPGFADVIAQSGSELPLLARTLVGASTALRSGGGAVFFTVAAVTAVTATAWFRTSGGQRAGARVLTGLPLVRGIWADIVGARFARTVGVLLTGGAPLLVALETSEQTVGSAIARQSVAEIIRAVQSGGTLSHAIAVGHLWPDLLKQLSAVGEQSGSLAQFMMKTADLLDESAERSLNSLVQLLEPGLIVAIGGAISLVALGLMQAVYSVNTGILP